MHDQPGCQCLQGGRHLLPANFCHPHPRTAPRDGDGTVPLCSLQVCDRWREAAAAAGTPPHNRSQLAGGPAAPAPVVRIRRYWGVKHGELLRSGEAFADILEALGELGPSAVAAS